MSDIPTTPEPSARRMPRWAKWTAIGAVVAVALFVGGIFLYAKVINDAPDELSAADLDAALSVEAADDTVTPVTSVAPVTATDAPAADTTLAAAAAPAAGSSSWVATDASTVGYRVEEVLFGVDTTAVGRTNQVTGTLTIAGTQVTTTEFVIDVASITSDESRRDGQFSGRIMSADEFPTASFVLTQPIELGAEPGEGVEVATTATGDLTLRGVTQSVTFDVVAKQANGLIGVQGSIPVLFADYSIANPSFGGISTEDNGLVEFVLVFQPA
jgi:polyisoprenoid-binding protein YceI